MDFFMEVAKLRAARLLWAELMAQFDPKEPKSSMLRTHCQTSGVSLTEQDPYNNIVRTTVEAMAGVLGGTQSLHTNSFDEALGLPTDFSARIARNTQLILAEETGITRTVDPLAGSYYVESLTAQLADRAREIISEVEAAGGMTKAIAAGTPKLRIEEAAALRQVRVDRGQDTIVGVNKYVADDGGSVDVLDIDNSEVRQQQVRRLEETRSQRDAPATEAALASVTETAIGDGNLLAACVAAARARATVGEISDAMEAVFERHRATTTLLSGVYAKAYEDDEEFASLTSAIREFEAAQGRKPRLFVAKMGQDGHDRGGRVIATAFADMGFDVFVGPLFQTPEEAAEEATQHEVDVIGVSSHAAGHLTLVPELIGELSNAGSTIAVICGGVIPPKDYDALTSAGVVGIFGPGTNVPEAAAEILRLIEDRRS